MSGFRRARLRRTYGRWMLAATGLTLLAGIGMFTAAADQNAVLLPWLVFALGVGAASLLVVMLPAGSAGPLARTSLALGFFAAELFVIAGGAKGSLERLTNRSGPLGDVWDTIGDWLSGNGLGLFDSVGWRLNLILGLALLIAYPMIRLAVAPGLSAVGAAVLSLVHDWRGLPLQGAHHQTDVHGQEEFFANLPARHTMLFIAVVSIAFVILMPPLAFGLDSAPMFGSPHVIEAAEHVAWVGSLVLVLELTALTLREAPPSVGPVGERAASRPGAGPSRVDDLYRRLCQAAANFIVYAFPRLGPSARPVEAREAAVAPRAATTWRRQDGPSALILLGLAGVSDLTPDNIEQLRGPVDAFLDPETPATRMRIAEGLTATHYLLFAQLVSHALDNGGTAVVIAPDQLVSDVRKNFELALAKLGLGFAVVLFEANLNPPPEHELFNLVLVPESLIDRGFLRYSDNYDGVLSRLSMVFLLETADMDLSWLRLRLFSLWQLASHDRTRIVVQSSTSRRLEEIVRMVATQGGRGEQFAVSLAPSTTNATHVVVFDDTAQFREHLKTQVLPGVRDTVSSALALAFESARFDCEPVVHKKSLDPPDVTRAESTWSTKVADLVQDRAIETIQGGQTALAKLGDDRFRAHLLPSDAPATIIAWDTYNFIAVREHNYNFFGAQAFLVQILSKNYPMRKFLRTVEESESGSDHAKSRELFRRHVPRLAGGIAELAYAAINAMRRKRGLARSQFRLILETIAQGGLVESAGIGNGRSGIDRLLQLYDVQSRVSVRETVDPLTGETLFMLQTTAGPLDFLDPVRVTQGGVALPADPLDYSDRGLAFGEQTNVRVSDKIWRVSSISKQEIRLVVPPGGGISNYVFVNRYQFRPELEPIIEYVSADQRLGGHVGTAILHLSYQRRTEEICDYTDGVEPFAPSATLNRRLTRGERWAVVDRNRQCVAHIVLNRLGDSLPVGERIGEPLPPEYRHAAVALGVCTIIKDTIRSLFPDLAHRIAVLSPSLTGVDRKLNTFAENPGPRDDALAKEAEQALFLADRVGRIDGFDRSFFESWAQPELRHVMTQDGDVLEILIVEDSDRDLGVARAIAQADGEVLRAAALFAADLAEEEQPEGPGSYLRFGASNLSRFIYLPGAANILRRLGRLPERHG